MKLKACLWLGFLVALTGWVYPAGAEDVAATVAALRERLLSTLSEEQLLELNEDQVLALLTPEEREIFATDYIRFRADQPVVVYVLRSVAEAGEVYWLEYLGFDLIDESALANLRKHRIWKREFDGGEIGLGVNTFAPQRDPVFIVVVPQNGDVTELDIEAHAPEGLSIDRAVPGNAVYSDDLAEVQQLPEALRGGLLLQTPRWERDHVKVVNYFKHTDYPAGDDADQVVLTWSGDPATTQTVQWRTGPDASRGAVAFLEADKHHSLSPTGLKIVEASSERHRSPGVLNDPINYRHEAKIEGLEPATEYVYAVGDGSEDGWGVLNRFRTAPQQHEAFSFIYMGDVQRGHDDWGLFLERTHTAHPEAAFYLLGGDLIDWGVDRDNWDEFFAHGYPVFAEKTLMPVVGNHEAYGPGRHPTLYLDFFGLPEEGPAGVEPERAYHFTYGDAVFLVLDSTAPAEPQAEWLDRVLSSSSATWKIVSFHFALYAAEHDRDYQAIREAWVPVIDRHEVDLVLQGHDHVYGRTYPMRSHRPVVPGGQGTTYVTAYSGTKHGDGITPNAAVALNGVPTYQIIDIFRDEKRLLYRAIDREGQVRDRLELKK